MEFVRLSCVQLVKGVLGENDKILSHKEYTRIGAKYKGEEVTAERSTQLNSKEKYRWRDV